MTGARPRLMRYQIADEPQRPMWTRIMVPGILLLPLTIFCAVAYSPIFWLLPAVNGLLVNGNHKFRDIGLSVLALMIFMIGIIGLATSEDGGLISRLTADIGFDAVLALTVAPLLKVLTDQETTMLLRAELAR
jgi:hypothetical protein